MHWEARKTVYLLYSYAMIACAIACAQTAPTLQGLNETQRLQVIHAAESMDRAAKLDQEGRHDEAFWLREQARADLANVGVNNDGFVRALSDSHGGAVDAVNTGLQAGDNMVAGGQRWADGINQVEGYVGRNSDLVRATSQLPQASAPAPAPAPAPTGGTSAGPMGCSGCGGGGGGGGGGIGPALLAGAAVGAAAGAIAGAAAGSKGNESTPTVSPTPTPAVELSMATQAAQASTAGELASLNTLGFLLLPTTCFSAALVQVPCNHPSAFRCFNSGGSLVPCR